MESSYDIQTLSLLAGVVARAAASVAAVGVVVRPVLAITNHIKTIFKTNFCPQTRVE